MEHDPQSHGQNVDPARVGRPRRRRRLLVAAAISGATLLLLLALVGIGYALYGSDTNVSQRAAAGGTKVVAVELTDFDVSPGTLVVDRGTHVVLEVTNTGDENHDLAFEGGRLHTSTLGHGQSQRLDLGTVTGHLESWCTLPFHKTLGMKLHIKVV
jgi:nitrite reductase (NO-forming)